MKIFRFFKFNHKTRSTHKGGTNNSSELSKGKIAAGDDCYFVRRGILSELVIFGDTLYANIAGPSATEETLVSILAGAGEVSTYRRSWRENY